MIRAGPDLTSPGLGGSFVAEIAVRDSVTPLAPRAVLRIPRKSITGSTVIAISRSTAKRSGDPVPGGAGGWTLLGGLGVSQVFVFAHRFSAQSELVGVVYQPVEDGVGKRGIADGGVPLLDRGSGW